MSAEAIRQELSLALTLAPGSREALEAEWGQVWDTAQLQADYEVQSFAAPYVLVKRKSDGQKGTLIFQSRPRFYFSFCPA